MKNIGPSPSAGSLKSGENIFPVMEKRRAIFCLQETEERPAFRVGKKRVITS